MTNAPFSSIEAFRDIESRNHYAEAVDAGVDSAAVLAALRAMSRDNARTPMQWDATPHAGFTSGTPWIEVNPNHGDVNAENAVRDPDSVLHHYRRLIALRHADRVVVDGDFRMLLPDHEQVYAFTRRLDEVELLVLANFSGDAVTVDLPERDAWAASETVLGNVPEASGDVASLRPWEARVHRRVLSRETAT
jgi:oligo-1,6-glucosidase